jgi:hypothetical protein
MCYTIKSVSKMLYAIYYVEYNVIIKKLNKKVYDNNSIRN